ncbi:MAG TPA: hypothetical protein VMR86_04830 [Myxococcota bacterium]|nr:hypothetical protein [Myxococcota bacterium]
MAHRLEGAAGAPIVLLGDVFERAGLLGFCTSDSHRQVSDAGCAQHGSADAQLAAILGPYTRSFAGHPLVALAGSVDHAGDPDATQAACARVPAAGPGWRWVARGCELDDAHPLTRLDAGALVLVLADSAAMLADDAFRARALAALHAELATLRQERPDAWLLLAMQQPLESYGARNGADLATAVHKDLYPVTGTLLWPIVRPIEWLVGRRAENLYEWPVRGLRRDVYQALADSPVDAVLSGQDESLQLMELERGARWQIVSGAGSDKSRVKRIFLESEPRLLFAAGRGDDFRSGYGFVAIAASPQKLRVEFWDMAVKQPLFVAELVRPH